MTKTSKALPRPTESELELLRILWETQPATVRDIRAFRLEQWSDFTPIMKSPM